MWDPEARLALQVSSVSLHACLGIRWPWAWAVVVMGSGPRRRGKRRAHSPSGW